MVKRQKKTTNFFPLQNAFLKFITNTDEFPEAFTPC